MHAEAMTLLFAGTCKIGTYLYKGYLKTEFKFIKKVNEFVKTQEKKLKLKALHGSYKLLRLAAKDKFLTT